MLDTMDEVIFLPLFCGNRSREDAFWDPGLTVNTHNPDLTWCFERSVLLWIPSFWLWLCCPAYFFYLCKESTVNTRMKCSPLNISKCVVGMVICLAAILDFGAIGQMLSSGHDVTPVRYLAPVITLITMVLFLCLCRLEFIKGKHTSGVLFIFWLLQSLVSVIIFRSLVTGSEGLNPNVLGSVALGIQCVSSWVELFLSLFADAKAIPNRIRCQKYAEKKPLLGTPEEENNNPSPERTASFLVKYTYMWILRFMIRGYRKPLKLENLYDLRTDFTSKAVVADYERYMNIVSQDGATYRNNAHASYGSWSSSDSKEHSSSFTEYQKESTSRDSTVRSGTKAKTLAWALFRSVALLHFGGMVMRMLATGLQFCNPLLLSLLIDFAGSSDSHLWKGVLYAVLLGLNNLVLSMVIHAWLYFGMNAGLKARTLLNAVIYRKALKLSHAARRRRTVGEIVNLMAVDSYKIQDCMYLLHQFHSIPLSLIGCIIYLWFIVGPSCFAGIGFLVILLIINGIYLANHIRKLQGSQMVEKDTRIKIFSEVLSGIKVLKLYAWEPYFQKRINDVREKELWCLKIASYLNAVGAIGWFLAPYLVTLIIFAVYVLISPENILDPKTAFLTLSVTNILNYPMSLLPMNVSYLTQAIVSLKRISRFTEEEEQEQPIISSIMSPGNVIEIRNGTFSWGVEESPALKNINLNIQHGQLIAVVGHVGAGKSSLVSAILGEMNNVSGDLALQGSFAYVPQQAWIQNATLKDNILFGKSEDSNRYKRCIQACALEPDLKILTGGDQTEIGEKGINLSGGQKQRVSLARAVYQNEDLYLLDDPLSAVDSHVGKHIFDHVIGPDGILSGKTRVFVTHGLTYLSKVDHIVVMREGQIYESGTLEELIDSQGAFAEFIKTYSTEEIINISETDEEFPQNVIQRLVSMSDTEPQHTAQRAAARRRKSTATSLSQESNKEKDDQLMKLITTETAEVGKVSWKVIGSYVKAGGWIMFILSVLSHLLFITSQTLTNIWLSVWSDDAVKNMSRDQNLLHERLGIYGALGIAQTVFICIESVAIALGCVMASRVLHNSTLNRVFHAPMSFFDTTPLGRIINRFSKDLDVVDSQLPLSIRSYMFAIAPLLTTVVVICYSVPIFLAILVPIAIIFYLAQLVYISNVRQLKRIDAIAKSPIYTHFDESLVGVVSMRAYGRQRDFVAKCDQLVDRSQKPWYLYIICMRWLGVFMEGILGVTVVLVVSLLAVLQSDAMSPGSAGLAISYALQVTLYLNIGIRCATEVETWIVSAERIQEYMEVPSEAAWQIPGSTGKFWPEHGQLQLKHYSTRYRPGLEPVLRDISCTIDPSERVGVVGRTGAGKSSLTLALFRLIEASEGTIHIDGVDISKIGLHQLRTKLTIIPQDPVLFSGTLRLNLDPFGQHDDQYIWEVLKLAHLKTFVSSLPAGLQYECGEAGEALSVGQRQLVCLARACLRRSKILILDEATAAVDLETDDLIQRTIRSEFKESTVITIAHRLSTVMDYDRVMVLDKGHIKEFDSPSKLLQNKKSSLYSMAKDAGLV